MDLRVLDPAQLGGAFAEGLARRDFDAAGSLLHREIDFAALTPRRAWAPQTHAEVIEVLRTWFATIEVDAAVELESGAVADVLRVAYRFTGSRPEGPFVLEQQAYFRTRDGQIAWMRILCSGFRTP
jgi:hypothetical protein